MTAIISNIFTQHPELALFLALALGYIIGKISIFGVKIGSVTGCLLAGVLVGQTGVVLANELKQAFFLFFLFSIGYRTGPQFFQGLNTAALPQIAITFILCATALLIGYVAALLFGFDPGTAAGVLAGGATESATVGVAIDTFRKTSPSAEEMKAFEGAIATAFAVAYLVGVVCTILIQSQLAPRMFRRTLKEACAEMEKELGEQPQDAGQSARRDVETRAFQVAPELVGKTVAEVEALVPKEQKAYIEQIRRDGNILVPDSGTEIRSGDVIAVAGLRGFLVASEERIGEEVDDAELLDLPVEKVDVVVTRPRFIGRRLWQLRREPESRTIFLRGVMRGGHRLPVFPGLTVHRGDIVTIYGTRGHVAEAIGMIGYADRKTSVTDMAYVAFFIFIGGLIGIPAAHLGAVELGLGVSVGVLLGGLVAGWLRSVKRHFGFVPEASLWIFDSVGLCAFIACVGISAGPSFVDGIMHSGVKLVAAAATIAAISNLVALAVGRWIFHMNEGVLAGVCCGASTSAPALAAVQEVAGSQVPTLGYGLGYAIGNVLLALWGAVLLAMMGVTG